MEEIQRGPKIVDGCENRFSLLKPFLLVHRGVSKKNLEGYVAWFELGREMRRGMREAVEEVLRVVGKNFCVFSLGVDRVGLGVLYLDLRG